MDIDSFNYDFLIPDTFAEKVESPPSAPLIKETLLLPPTILASYTFRLQTNKPFTGLKKTAENHEWLVEPEADSQLQAFEDDDLCDIDEPEYIQRDPSPTEPIPPQWAQIRVVVRQRSLLIDSVEFALPTDIRSVVKVPGVRTLHDRIEEDSLMVSLKSGYLLLIRVWLVPRGYRDGDYHLQGRAVPTTTNLVFRPFVVQWWNANCGDPTTIPEVGYHKTPGSLDVSGKTLHAHKSGLLVVSTSASGAFRIYNTQYTSTGMLLKKHFNVDVDRLILHSCFADCTDHIMFLVLAFTENRRLALTLYTWDAGESIALSFQRSTLPLDNTFKIPVFVAPAGENFLFVGTDSIVVVSPHNILSAEYSFREITAPWDFPTAFTLDEKDQKNENLQGDNEERALERTLIESPNENSLIDTSGDVWIAAKSGAIYRVLVSDDDYKIEKVLRAHDAISVFTISPSRYGYRLFYASDTGSAREVLATPLDGNAEYSTFRRIRDYRMWAPLTQAIVDLTNSLWGITGLSKKARLTNFRCGYRAERSRVLYENLRKCERLTAVALNGRELLFCLMAYDTVLLEREEMKEDEEIKEDGEQSGKSDWGLSLLETDGILAKEASLYVGAVQGCILQVTRSGMMMTDFGEVQWWQPLVVPIILVDRKDDEIVFVLEGGTIEVYQTGEIDPRAGGLRESGFLRECARTKVEYEPLAVMLTSNAVVVGDYDGVLRVYRRESEEGEKDIIMSDIEQEGDEKESGSDHENDQHGFHDNSGIHFSLQLTHSININTFNPYPSDTVPLVIHEIIANSRGYAIGTKSGHYVQLDRLWQPLKFLRVSSLPVRFCVSPDPEVFLLVSKAIWEVNYYDSEYPTRVNFDETTEHTVTAMAALGEFARGHAPLHSYSANSFPFAVVRSDGLAFASIGTFKQPVVRQARVENAKRALHLSHLLLFCVLCHSKSPKSRLKFVDQRTQRVVRHVEVHKKNENIFAPGELPLCLTIWSIQRNGRVSKKLLVGCSREERSERNGRSSERRSRSEGDRYGERERSSEGSGRERSSSSDEGRLGSFKVLETVNNKGDLQVLELSFFEHHEPITNILQFEDDILFTSGASIYVTGYNPVERRLRPKVLLHKMVSDIVSLVFDDNMLLVTTAKDLVFRFEYDGLMWLKASDPLPNSFINQVRLGDTYLAGDKLLSSLAIMDSSYSAASRTRYQLSMVPRVYHTLLQTPWVQDKRRLSDYLLNPQSDLVLCVGVNGEVLLFRQPAPQEMETLASRLSTGPFHNAIGDYVDMLSRPFDDKVTGMGIFEVYKPAFDYRENRGVLVDYDIRDVSRVAERRVA